MTLVGDKKLFRTVIVISQKISFLPEGIPGDDMTYIDMYVAIICDD